MIIDWNQAVASEPQYSKTLNQLVLGELDLANA